LATVNDGDGETRIGLLESTVHIDILSNDLSKVLVFSYSHTVSFIHLDKYTPFCERLMVSFPTSLEKKIEQKRQFGFKNDSRKKITEAKTDGPPAAPQSMQEGPREGP